jgi:hypothetical protein
MSEASPSAAPHPRDGLGFWRRPWVQNVLPLLTSLALHASFAVALLLAYSAGCKIAETRQAETQVSVASSELVETRPAAGGGVHDVRLAGDPTHPPAQDQSAESDGGWAPKPGQPDARALVPGSGGDSDPDPVIGLSVTGGGFLKHPDGSYVVAGGARADPRGPLAPFGINGGGAGAGAGPFNIRFVEVPGGNARTVVFVCDASGSMINTFGSLKAELVKAVLHLKSVHAFNIIFFQDEKFAALDEKGLVFATPDNKQRAVRWLDTIATTGTTDPIPAIEQAFRNKPQLIYLLTDADFPDNNAVRTAVSRLNADKQTRINTIIFTMGDATPDDGVSNAFLALMKQIAKDNGGVFSRVKESALH